MKREEILRAFTLANEFKEGDLLVGGGNDDRLRREAREAVSRLRVSEVTHTSFVDDGVTEALARSLDRQLLTEISHLAINEIKDILLGSNGADWARRYSPALSSETIAAVVKLMSNEELSRVARALFNPLPGAMLPIGASAHFGSRIQPNSPGDDDEEILLSIMEGLSYGCGDVIIGLNPASDDLDTIVELEKLLEQVVNRLSLPTRYCVLSDIVKQTAARARTRVDVGFQSLAGTSKGLAGMVGLDVEGLLDQARGFDGLYFETGQGSTVTQGSAEGVDMVTLEARNYGLARHIRARTGSWMIVNDVAGFIGPEVFRLPDQLLRACLEDTVMAKLHGITMGLDVCATFHMGIDPDTLQQLTETIVERAAPAYLMAVAGNADPMLGYLTTSFREHPRLRRQSGKKISHSMNRRLSELGITDSEGELKNNRPTAADLYAIFLKQGGDARNITLLAEQGQKRIEKIKARGFDLGYGHGDDYREPPEIKTRLHTIYRNAREALYATISDQVLKDAAPRHIKVRTNAHDRDDYLQHPSAGESIRPSDCALISALYPVNRPQVQIVVSDGLNANAVNENLRATLPYLIKLLGEGSYNIGDRVIVISEGRVRAGYHIGQILDCEAIVHFIGERPGTGLNTLSAYITYGRDREGVSRWSTNLDHACTGAICGIHRLGKAPEKAAEEIANYVQQMLQSRCSGVALTNL